MLLVVYLVNFYSAGVETQGRRIGSMLEKNNVKYLNENLEAETRVKMVPRQGRESSSQVDSSKVQIKVFVLYV
jgi:hypothetical protein